MQQWQSALKRLEEERKRIEAELAPLRLRRDLEIVAIYAKRRLTLQQIGDQFGITGSRVRGIAMRRLLDAKLAAFVEIEGTKQDVLSKEIIEFVDKRQIFTLQCTETDWAAIRETTDPTNPWSRPWVWDGPWHGSNEERAIEGAAQALAAHWNDGRSVAYTMKIVRASPDKET